MTNSPRRLGWRKKLLFALVTLASVALTAEIALRLIAPQFLVVSHSWHRLHQSVDWNDHDLGPDRQARFVVRRPDGGELWDFAARTSALSLRCGAAGAKELPPAQPGQSIVHCIGDSFTFGWGVEFEESYPSVLQQLLGDRHLVLNLGDASFGLIAATTKSDLIAARYSPDVIVWQFDDSDFDDDEKTVRFQHRDWVTKPVHECRYALCDHSYLACVPWALGLQFAYQGLEILDARNIDSPPRDLATIGALSARAEQKLASLSPAANRGATTLARLTALGARCRERRQRLVVVMQEIDGPEALVYQQARAAGIEVVVLPTFAGWLIPGDFHLNAEGNRLLAELVAARVFAEPSPGRVDAVTE